MTKTSVRWTLILIWSFFIIYIISISQRATILGISLSIVGSLGAFGLLFYAYKKLRFYRTSWLMSSLACLSWTLGDFIWLYWELVLGLDPTDSTLFMYLFLLPNIFIAWAVGAFLLSSKNSLNFYQLILDALVTACFSVGLIWIIFFQNHFQLILDNDLDNLAVFLYIIIDFFTLGVLFILYVSRRFDQTSPTLHCIVFGVVLYTVADIYYIYQFLHDTYVPYSISDGIFMASFLVIASSGVLEIANSTRHFNNHSDKLPSNYGTAKRFRLLLFIPILVILIRGFQVKEIAFLTIVLLVHQALSGYVQSLIESEYLLKQEKEMNVLLEQRVAEHTQRLVRTNRELELLAQRDNLTDTYNRRYFQSRLDQMIATTNWSEKVILLFMDFDRFKAINDSYGHDIGDKLLVEVANRLKKIINPSMLLARLGGDEFVIAIKANMRRRILKY